MENVCFSFRTGSVALAEQRNGISPQRSHPVGSLVHRDDPDGWHEFVHGRRRRWS